MSDKTSKDRLVLGAPPRADLLPPELKAEEKLRSQRRGLVGVAVLAVFLVAAGYVYAVFSAQSAASNLAAANAQTQSLLDQKNKYIEVRELSDQRDTIKLLRQVAVYNEVDWREYFVRVATILPPGTNLTTVTGNVTDLSKAPASPLLKPSVAELVFVAKTTTLPNVSAWVDSLSDLPGFADATTGAIDFQEDDGLYAVTITLHLNTDALHHRFTGNDLNGNGVPDSKDVDPTATPTPTPSVTPVPSGTPTGGDN